MRRLLLAATLLASPALAEEVQYITPEIPTEAMKIEALKLGYIANGFSMVGNGSIDVSSAFKVYPPPPVEAAAAAPPAAKEPPRRRRSYRYHYRRHRH